jgi:methyl-accepting chemotaxis protein
MRQRVLLGAGFLAGALVICIVVALIIVKSITRPVGQAIRVIQELSSGNLNARVEGHANDELGHMCDSLNCH